MTELTITDEDKEGLDSNFPSCWTLARSDDGAEHGIIISGYPLPDDIYTAETTDLMVLVPNGYPMSPMDMFYCDPALVRKDGRAINALEQETHFGRSWQRWSRHYGPNEWDLNMHNVITHLSLVANQLRYDRA